MCTYGYWCSKHVKIYILQVDEFPLSTLCQEIVIFLLEGTYGSATLQSSRISIIIQVNNRKRDSK